MPSARERSERHQRLSGQPGVPEPRRRGRSWGAPAGRARGAPTPQARGPSAGRPLAPSHQPPFPFPLPGAILPTRSGGGACPLFPESGPGGVKEGWLEPSLPLPPTLPKAAACLRRSGRGRGPRRAEGIPSRGAPGSAGLFLDLRGDSSARSSRGWRRAPPRGGAVAPRCPTRGSGK